jgi:hypothetical protein
MSRDLVPSEYSFELINKADLRRLASLALDYFDGLFKRMPHLKLRFRELLLLLALCRGEPLCIMLMGRMVLKSLTCGLSLKRRLPRLFHREVTAGATSGIPALVVTLTLKITKARRTRPRLNMARWSACSGSVHKFHSTCLRANRSQRDCVASFQFDARLR